MSDITNIETPELTAPGPASAAESTEEPRTRRLQDLTPNEIREIAARYGFKITGMAGNTGGRVFFFLLCGALLFAALAFAGSFIFAVAPWWVRFGVVIGIWVILFPGILVPRLFIVAVPQLTGVKALNPLNRRVHTYLPGLNICYPQEVIGKNDYLTLRSDVISEKSEFTSMDGVKVIFEKPSLRWRVFPALLLLNASHSNETIKMGATEIFKTTLSNQIIHTNIAEIRTAVKLEEIQQALIRGLEGKTARHLDAHGSTFEEQYGVTAEIPALGPPELSDEYSNALESAASMVIYRGSADDLVKGSDAENRMEFGQALNAVMIAGKEGVRKDIFEIQMDRNSRDGLGELGRGAGPIVAGAAALAAKAMNEKPKGDAP